MRSQDWRPEILFINMIFYVLVKLFLDSSFESNGKDLTMEGYDLIRSHHPSNTKGGCVCIYYKWSLAVRIVNMTSSTGLRSCNTKTKKDMLLLCTNLLVKALENLNPFYLVWRTCLVIHFVHHHFSWPHRQITRMMIPGYYYLTWLSNWLPRISAWF